MPGSIPYSSGQGLGPFDPNNDPLTKGTSESFRMSTILPQKTKIHVRIMCQNFVSRYLNRYIQMKPKPQSDVKPGPHKMRVENSQDGQFDATSASAEAFPKPPSSTANRSAQSRKQFRETWSSIAPSLKVISPDEMFEQVR